jgi:transketolase
VLNPSDLRKSILKMAYTGNSCHIACAFSLVEILSVLYTYFSDDLILLSKGHGVMAQYACLAELGIIPESWLKNYLKDGTILKGLSDAHVPGLHVSSGSLGHGLSVGIGIALSNKLKKINQKVFVIVGDGECNEGAIYEGLLFASQHQLTNLIIIVDANGYQAMGKTDEIINLENLEDKFNSFGFEIQEINGNDLPDIKDAISYATYADRATPQAIIARTTKGQGTSFMRDDNSWHYKKLSPELYKKAIEELK